MNFRNYYQSRLLDSLSKSYDKKGKDTTGRGRKHELVDFVDTDPVRKPKLKICFHPRF